MTNSPDEANLGQVGSQDSQNDDFCDDESRSDNFCD